MNASLARTRTRYWLDVARWSLIVLLAFELGARLFIVHSPQREYLPEWGVIPVEGSYAMQGLEGYAFQSYFADGEVETPYRDGLSIVVLGDSTTLAAQVAPEENFVSLTETKLRQDGYNVDLHNLGRSARLMSDHVFLAPAVNAAYAPQIVIVQVSLDSFTLSFDPANENYFVEEGEGLSLIHQEPPSLRELKYRNLVTLSSLLDHLDFRLRFTLDQTAKKYLGAGLALGGIAIHDMNALPEADMESLSQEEDLLRARRQAVAQVRALRAAYPNSRLILLVAADPPKVDAATRQIVWETPEDAQLVGVLERMSGVKLVYTLKIFQRYYDEYKVLPRGNFNSAFNFGHLNPNGHQAVAEVLTDALEEILK
jgi:lysophospholipase L1-like esterase